jgi:hypothetical protein
MAAAGRRTWARLALLAAVAAGGLGAGWAWRAELLAWVYVRGLAHADDGSRAAWVGRVAGAGEAAVPGLLGCLGETDPTACANARAGLARLAELWGPDDPRAETLTARLAAEWDRFSPAGQVQALGLTASWVAGPAGEPAPPGLAAACARLLGAAAPSDDPAVQAQALELADALLRRPEGAEFLGPARGLARAGLASGEPLNRLRAVRLALYPGMDLLEHVAGLLGDPAADVRRAALLAVGPADQAVRDEALLPSLHDPDPDVRRLCEAALAGRGLRPEHVQLGRLLTDPSPVMRVRVLDQLRTAPELDAGVWLRRLSHDPSPAVRAAALRAMSQQTAVDLSDRLDQMARGDPSPTVAALARYYLRSAKLTGPAAE